MFPKTKWVVLWSLWLARLVPQPSPVVRVEQGALRGRLAPDGTHYQFFGIPYATSGSQYRFKVPTHIKLNLHRCSIFNYK